jgi:hypothetical protein
MKTIATKDGSFITFGHDGIANIWGIPTRAFLIV